MSLILMDPVDAPEIPKWFLDRLRDTDAGLVIYWNRFKRRFVVDRCINMDPHTHSATCERSNVLIVESDEGTYMPPCDRVIDKIRSMDAWTNFKNLENFRLDHENKEAEAKEKRIEEARTGYKETMLDNKRQIQHVIDMVKRHDLARPNK